MLLTIQENNAGLGLIDLLALIAKVLKDNSTFE